MTTLQNWTIDDLPPVLWNVQVVGEHGLGLSANASLDYAGEIEKRINVGARVLGTVKQPEVFIEGVTVVGPEIVSDTPLAPSEVPVLIGHWGGRKNRAGSNLAEFHRLDDNRRLRRIVTRLARRQADPVILGTGFPQVSDHWRDDDGDAVDAVADYLEARVGLEVDDAMGRPEELGAIVEAAREQAGLAPDEGIVIGESATLNNRARWKTSTDIDRRALVESGIPWIIRAGTFGRSVLLPNGVNVQNPNLPPIYLLVTAADNLTADEVKAFGDLGYDRWVLQGVGLGSPVAAAARERLRGWREEREAAEEPNGPARLGATVRAVRDESGAIVNGGGGR